MGRPKPLNGTVGVTKPKAQEVKVALEAGDIAKEVAERYRGIIPQSATYADVYVALNAQYHDYCELLKAWFGDNIDNKVVESAVSFWFKDDDYKGGNKVYKYFREA